MLMNALKSFVNNSIKKSFHEKRKKKKQLGYVLIFFYFTCETYFF